jgi:peptidyl-prolyl cis-trans isomerase D
MAELMKSNGGDIHAAAKAMGLEVKTTDDFSRYGAAEGLGSATGLTDAFDKPVGSWFGPLNLGSQTIVAKIVEQIPADMSKLPAERSSIVTQLKSKLSQERQELLEDAIVNKLSQEGKIKKHNDVINRMIARYRS